MTVMKRCVCLLLMTFCVSMIFVCDLSAKQIKETPRFPTPFLLTSAGQSPDALMVKIISKRKKLDMKYNLLAQTSDLADIKSLLLVMGVSMKGLGTAGIKLEKEVARVHGLIKEAKKKKIKVIGMFAGGAGGRGGRDKLTDSVISQVAPKVDHLVVIKSGDKDGFIKGLAEKNNIPITYMKNILELKKIVPALFSGKK